MLTSDRSTRPRFTTLTRTAWQAGALLLWAVAAQAGPGDQASIYRRFLSSRGTTAERESAPAAATVPALPADAAFTGVEVSTDTAAGQFRQDQPAIARFSGGRYLCTWRDDRQGDARIYGRLFTRLWTPIGGEYALITDGVDRSPLTPVAAGDGRSVLVGWIDAALNHFFVALADSLGVAGAPVVVDGTPAPQILGGAAVGHLHPRGFAAAWEEFRSGGWHVFVQRFDSLGVRAGVNVQADDGSDTLLRITPTLAGDTSGGFLVAWSEGGPSRCDIYVRKFAPDGTPSPGAVALTSPSGGESYMLPHLVFVPVSNQYWLTYVRTDLPADSTVLFVRRLSQSGAPIDSAQALAAGPYPWVPRAAATAARVAFYTARYDNLGQIRALEVNTSLVVTDSSEVISDLAVRERSLPDVAAGPDTQAVVWQDRASGAYDIRGRLRAAGAQASAEDRLHDEGTGGSQQHASLFARSAGGVHVVFTDNQQGGGDIALVDVQEDGTIAARRRVNDDGTLAPQYDPASASDTLGRSVVTWTDERSDWTGPARHAAMRFLQGGVFTGPAAPVAEVSTASSQSETRVGMSAQGLTTIVWVDDRAGTRNAYLRRFDATGGPLSGDIALNDGGLSQIVVLLETAPGVSFDSTGRFWTAWSVRDEITDSFHVLAQAWTAGGVRRGTNLDVSPRGHTSAALDFAMMANNDGTLRMAWYDPSAGVEAVRIAAFDTAGNPVGVFERVSDSGVAAFDPALTRDPLSGRWAVSWSQKSGVHENVLWRRFNADGSPVTGPEVISGVSTATRRRLSGMTFSGAYLYAAWHDNQTPDAGYNVRLSSILKTSASVNEATGMLPGRISLRPNYPNPFNPQTVIEYSIAVAAHVRLEIIDVLGRHVRTLVDGLRLPGEYRTAWDGTDERGQRSGSGVYFYRLEAGDSRETRKMLLLR